MLMRPNTKTANLGQVFKGKYCQDVYLQITFYVHFDFYKYLHHLDLIITHYAHNIQLYNHEAFH